jgi:hypothetical protein
MKAKPVTGEEYMRHLRDNCDPPTGTSFREPSKREQAKTILNLTGLAALGLLCAAGITRCDNNNKATNEGTAVRAELMAAMPEGKTLPKEIHTELDCIAGRASRICRTTIGEDSFEDKNCEPARLDAYQTSGGEQKPIRGLSTAAKILVAPYGIEPELYCTGGSTKKLEITVHEDK